MYQKSALFSATNKKFNVIILAAGMGSRLKPETDYIPKALVQVGGLRAIDYCITKYQYVTGRVIIATGYCSDLVKNYVTGRYPSLEPFFSTEDVSELRGPGTSIMYALDFASSKLPTIITFCDYIVGDQFSVEYDNIGICKPNHEMSVLGEYKTIVTVDEGVAIDIRANEDLEHAKDNGFTGIAVCHNTKLLKAITYTAAASNNNSEGIDYAFEIITEYIKRVKTMVSPLSRLLEFGSNDTLMKTRRYVNGDR